MIRWFACVSFSSIIDFTSSFCIIIIMPFDVCVKAPAKVNIGLNVLKRRADGFHDIESIFHVVDFCDKLEIRRIPEKKCIARCDEMVLPADNTLTRTYNAFCDAVEIDFGVEILLKKNIPSGGGLGGGSSDAASLLRVLEEFAGIGYDEELADSVAAKVGSDVFFFLRCGLEAGKKRCAFVSGRGELVRPMDGRSDVFFVMVFPDVQSSTREAYRLVDDAYSSGGIHVISGFSGLVDSYYGSVSGWNFSNSFTPVLVNTYPLIGEALQDIKKSGADWADMSGSGATVFGVFESALAAEKAVFECRKKWRCVLAH